MRMMNGGTLAGQASTEIGETVWLLGQPSLADYLHFVQHKTIDGAVADRAALISEWSAANDYYAELEAREAGIADKVRQRPLPKSLAAAVERIRADRRFRSAFDLLPTRFAMVELDKIVVSQQHIDITHTGKLQQGLGEKADAETLLNFCQKIDQPHAPFAVRRIARNRYTFQSPSSDFRYHEPMVLTPDQFVPDAKDRPDDVMLGLSVGYSSNFLSLIESEKRLVLNNGHHRAFALKALGYTHAPCIIQTVTRIDELNLVASATIVQEAKRYFMAARPPLLKDFFDLRIRKVLFVPRLLRVVEISFEVREFEVTA